MLKIQTSPTETISVLIRDGQIVGQLAQGEMENPEYPDRTDEYLENDLRQRSSGELSSLFERARQKSALDEEILSPEEMRQNREFIESERTYWA